MTFYTKLQPTEQFEVVCMVAGACLFFAVILREFFRDRDIQIAGGALGGAGCLVLMLFGWRMAVTVENLQTQIARVQDAQEVSNQIGFVAVEEEYSTTFGDQTVSLVKYDDGRVGPVSVTAGRKDSVGHRTGSGTGDTAGSGRAGHAENEHAHDLQNAEHVMSF